MCALGGDQHRYTASNAKLYASIGIDGTTYEIGFDAVREMLGDIRGQTFLDFGCGAGRSTEFLADLGAGRVYGVDHDSRMLDVARARVMAGTTLLLASEEIPLPDASVDGAISLNVFIEIRTRGQMRRICAEVARVLRPGGSFIVESSSPMAFGHTSAATAIRHRKGFAAAPGHRALSARTEARSSSRTPTGPRTTTSVPSRMRD